VGDLAPRGRAQAPFCSGDSSWFGAGLEPYWSAVDYRVVNKESLAHWTTGLLCELVLGKGQAAEVNLIPIVHSEAEDARPQLAEAVKASEVLAGQEVLSKTLQDKAAYSEVWEAFARAQAKAFFYDQFPLGRVGRRLLRMLPIMQVPGAKKRLLKSLNRLECEAHSDPITAGLKYLAGVED